MPSKATTSGLHLQPRHRRMIEGLAARHLPGVDIWAYGSRVNGKSRHGSDLDLVLRGPKLAEIPSRQLGTFREVLEESTLPFRVDAHDWARLPEGFHGEIQRNYVALVSAPGRWRDVTLGDCIEIDDATYAPKEQWPFINYLDTGNLTEGRIDAIQHWVADEDKIPSRARRKVRQGDVLYSTVRPDQRHFGIMKNVPENFLASTGFAVIRGKTDCADTRFIYWFLAQDSVVEQLHTIAEHSMSAYPSIRPADIEQLRLRLPPLPEQRAIAGILGALDDKIELNRRMADTLGEAVQALFKSWFVDRPVQHSSLRRWRLEEIATRSKVSVSPNRKPERTYEHYSIPAYDAGGLPALESGASIRSNKTLIPKDAVLVSKLNPSTPRSWVPDCRGIVTKIASTEFLVFVPKAGFGRGLLSAIFGSGRFQQDLRGLATGTSKSHQRALPSDVENLECVTGEQTEFAAFEAAVGPLVEKQVLMTAEIRALAQLRDTLLPRLISGECSLREAEKIAENAM